MKLIKLLTNSVTALTEGEGVDDTGMVIEQIKEAIALLGGTPGTTSGESMRLCIIIDGDDPDVFIIRQTNAPQSYDGFGTISLVDCGDPDDKANYIRLVAIRPDHLEWQEGRYGSGMNNVTDPIIDARGLRETIFNKLSPKQTYADASQLSSQTASRVKQDFDSAVSTIAGYKNTGDYLAYLRGLAEDLTASGHPATAEDYTTMVRLIEEVTS